MIQFNKLMKAQMLLILETYNEINIYLIKIKINCKILIISKIKFNKYMIKLMTFRNINKTNKILNKNYKIIIIIKNKINFSNRKLSL